jgi:tetratricopeptide (TPR) repeat protein
MSLSPEDKNRLIKCLERCASLKESSAKEKFCLEVFLTSDSSRLNDLIHAGKNEFATLIVGDVETVDHPLTYERCYRATLNAANNPDDKAWLKTKLDGFSDEAIELFRENDLILNPYMIDEGLLPREEEKMLGDWLVGGDDPDDRFLCITDFGGAGKTALVWKWLNSKDSLHWRFEKKCQLFWSTFYARNYNSLDFLRKIALKLKIDGVDASGTPPRGLDVNHPTYFRQAWSTLIDSILSRLASINQPWLIVIDGLEREMGMYADPANQPYDSQAQDTRKEQDQDSADRFHPDYDIRSAVFCEFLNKVVSRSNRSLRLIATSRLFPNNIPKNNPLQSGFRNIPLGSFDTHKLWSSVTDCEEPDQLAKRFLAQVGNHPQIVSIVAAAFNESGQESFQTWLQNVQDNFHAFLHDLDKEPWVTNRRHAWLALATKDLVDKTLHWGLLCRVACNPGESSIRSLHDTAKKLAGDDYSWTFQKTQGILEELKARRLVGIGQHTPVSSDAMQSPQQFVDIHPVVRCHLYQYALTLHQRNPIRHTDSERLIHQVLKQAESDSGLFLGLIDPRNYEERLLQLQERYGSDGLPFDQAANYDQIWNDHFARFYPQDPAAGDPRMRMPAVRLRKNQAYISMQSAHLFTVTGRWEESMQAYRVAEIAYELTGDLESSIETKQARTWQQLYGGSLFDFEKFFVQRYRNDRNLWNPQSDPLWLAIGLAVRRFPRTTELLESLEVFYKKSKDGWSRWQAQTLAECWYYLAKTPEEFRRPIEIIDGLNALTHATHPIQRVWEILTQGICYIEQGDLVSARHCLEQGREVSIKKNDAVTYSFALAYMVELEAAVAQQAIQDQQATKEKKALAMIHAVEQAKQHHGKYHHQRDKEGRFQVPATIANLGLSRATWIASRGTDAELLTEALKHARTAYRIAAGADPEFGFGLGIEKAQAMIAMINKKLKDGIGEEIQQLSKGLSPILKNSHAKELDLAIQELLKELAS